MNRTDQPAVVQRWILVPLLWLLPAIGLAGWLTWVDDQAERDVEREFAHGPRVEARPSADWDGGEQVDLTYRHPSGQIVRATADVSDGELIPAPHEAVAARVSVDNPTRVQIVGDSQAQGTPVTYLLFLVPPLVLWVARRRSALQAAKLAASDAVAYQMGAVASSPGWWSWRWRLHLYPLDVASGAPPVCTVPLIGQPSELGTRIVEAKGALRPWGLAIARDQASGEVLWPSGRCLRAPGWGRRRLEPGRSFRPTPTSRWLMVAGLAVLIAGAITDNFVDDSIDIEARRYAVQAQAVGRSDDGLETEVRFEWLGERIESSVAATPAPSIGEPVEVLIDPEDPSRVWMAGEYPPGGDLVGGIYLLGLVMVSAGAIGRISARHRARTEMIEAAGSGVPLRAYWFTHRKPRLTVAAPWLWLSIPNYFGGRRWRVPLDQVAVADLGSSASDPVGGSDVFVRPVVLPYLFTTGPATAPNLVLLFRRPQRVPPLRAIVALAPNVDLPFGYWDTRSDVGVFVDGVALRAVDPAAAVEVLRAFDVEVAEHPPQWLRSHRAMVTDPVELARISHVRDALVWKERGANAMLIAGLFAAVLGMGEESVTWWLAAPGIALLVVGLALRTTVRRAVRQASRGHL